jgi:hypothetical protein
MSASFSSKAMCCLASSEEREEYIGVPPCRAISELSTRGNLTAGRPADEIQFHADSVGRFGAASKERHPGADPLRGLPASRPAATAGVENPSPAPTNRVSGIRWRRPAPGRSSISRARRRGGAGVRVRGRRDPHGAPGPAVSSRARRSSRSSWIVCAPSSRCLPTRRGTWSGRTRRSCGSWRRRGSRWTVPWFGYSSSGLAHRSKRRACLPMTVTFRRSSNRRPTYDTRGPCRHASSTLPGAGWRI